VETRDLDVEEELLGDDELVEMAEQGKTEVISVLVDRYSRELFPYLLRMTGHVQTAEDIFQETFIRIMTKRGKYHGQGNFRAFLFTIARNLVYDMLRKKRVRKELSLDSALDDDDQTREFAVHAETPADVLSSRELAVSVECALDKLAPKLKEALILKRFCDYSYEQIARMVGCSVSAVKMRVSRALSQLGRYMASECENEGSRKT